jgi:two-component system alkaline phosphatase synthesis response regulator PhoP
MLTARDGSHRGGPVSRRMLVVDDDEAIREVVRTGLEVVAGWEVRLASNGAEALSLCSADPPDAILLDVMMPTMDGPTTFGKLQEDPRTRSVPVILLTAKVQPSERRRYEELGVAGVLAKPFDPLALPGEIADLLGWQL